jgi:hypothetical protein
VPSSNGPLVGDASHDDLIVWLAYNEAEALSLYVPLQQSSDGGRLIDKQKAVGDPYAMAPSPPSVQRRD